VFSFYLFNSTMTDTTRLPATLYVGGLSPLVTLSTLTNAFLPFGTIVDVNLPKPENPNSTEHHRGFGYVEFELPEDADEARDNMDQAELFGKVIKVAKARPIKEQGDGLGSKLAVWEQVRPSLF
jgi:RNA recognition motif-containing protein